VSNGQGEFFLDCDGNNCQLGEHGCSMCSAGDGRVEGAVARLGCPLEGGLTVCSR